MMMKAIQVHRYGAIGDSLRLASVHVPKPKEYEVLVEVHAASVNPVDYKRVSGATKAVLPFDFPATLGYDLSGVVKEIGAKVKAFQVGDEVYAGLEHGIGSGAFAEYAVIPEHAVAHKPHNLSHIEAASIPVVGLTAWQAFTEVFKLQPGHKVLIHAGAGGLGTIAIQLAKRLEAIVATTASAPKHDLVKKLGADLIVDYRTDNFRRMLKDYDLVLDAVGGQTLLDSFYCVKPGGMVISVSGAPDNQFGQSVNANLLIRAGIWMMNRPVYRVAREVGASYRFFLKKSRREDLERLTNLFEQHLLVPVIDRTFPLEQAVDALTYLQAGHATGKVVLTVRE